MKLLTLLLSLIVFSSVVNAQRYDITADIGQIRYHEADNTLATSWPKHVWFQLENISQTPDCQKISGKYAISIPDGNDTAMSILLAAKLADKKVVVTIDDSVKFPRGNYCKLSYLTLK